MDLLQCCARHLADEALLLDLERLHARSLALVARRSVEASEDNVDEWLAGRVSDAATQLIDEERYEDRLGFPPPREADPRSELLVAVLGIEPALSRGVSVTFHRMSRQARRTFWRAVVSGEPIAGIAEDRDSTRESVLEGLRHVIRSLSLSGVEENAQSKPEPGDPGQEKS